MEPFSLVTYIKTPLRSWQRAIPLLIGIVLLLTSLFLAGQSLLLFLTSTTTTGTVERFVTEQDKDGDLSYFPIISFTAQNGDAVEFRGGTDGTAPSYVPGEQVAIRYQSDQPQNARIDDFLSFWMVPLILAVAGIVFTLIGLLFTAGPQLGLSPIPVVTSIFTVAGLAMLILGFNWLLQVNSFTQRATAVASGTVTDCYYNTRIVSRQICSPLVSFQTTKGEQVTFVPQTSSKEHFEKGQTVDVQYDPAKPRDARLNSGDNPAIGAYIIMGLGGGFFLLSGSIGLGFLLMGRRRAASVPVYTHGGMRMVERRGFSTRAPLLVLAVVPLLGVIFLSVGILVYNQTNAFVSRATGSATGVIIACDYIKSSSSSTSSSSSSKKSSSSSRMCRPTIRFTTQEGKTIVYTSSTSSTEFKVGQQMPLIYDPRNPQDAGSPSFADLWLLPLIFGGVGVLLLLISVVIGVILYRKLRPRQPEYPYS